MDPTTKELVTLLMEKWVSEERPGGWCVRGTSGTGWRWRKGVGGWRGASNCRHAPAGWWREWLHLGLSSCAGWWLDPFVQASAPWP